MRRRHMNSGKTIFAQLMDFVPTYEFRKCVDRYNGNHKVIIFSCWDQYLCMAFTQLTYRESLRDILRKIKDGCGMRTLESAVSL
jgi:hypothetical protein